MNPKPYLFAALALSPAAGFAGLELEGPLAAAALCLATSLAVGLVFAVRVALDLSATLAALDETFATAGFVDLPSGSVFVMRTGATVPGRDELPGETPKGVEDAMRDRPSDDEAGA